MNAEDIKALREKLGLTQEALAREVHVSFSTVNKWENNKQSPSPMAVGNLERLRKEYDKSLIIVMDIKENEEGE